MMVIKINYKLTAVFLALLLCVGVVLAEQAIPLTISTTTTVSEDIVLPVLMYHHILKSTDRIGDYVITPTQFESDLKYINENGYTTVSVQDLLNFANKKATLPKKPILITFDDGYETTYQYAFPLLKKYDMCAVVSVIGRYTEVFSKEPQPHHLSYSHLSWEQLCEMESSGVFEIGNHTYNMHSPEGSSRKGIRQLRGESVDDYQLTLQKDIGGLNQLIKKNVGVDTTIFAYPFGAISKESPRIVKDMGFNVLLTCEEKVNILNSNTTSPLKLSRFNRAGMYSTADFFAKFS